MVKILLCAACVLSLRLVWSQGLSDEGRRWPVQHKASAPQKDLGVQLADNPPMTIIARAPPPPAPVTDVFEIREGFMLIESLDAFRAAIKKDGQKIRMKPGVYRAETVDPPLKHRVGRSDRTADQEHIFAVTGSGNHFEPLAFIVIWTADLQDSIR